MAESVDSIELRPFEAQHLPLVLPWFDDPEVELRLGGRDWPARALRLQERALAGEEFRGRRVLREHTWLAWHRSVPVGYLGGEVYDRWCRWDGSDPERPVVSHVEAGPAMGAAYVVDPGRWRQGYGVAMLRTWLRDPEVADVRVFALGIDDDNLASRRCAVRAGFVADPPATDWEGMVHHLFRR